MDDERTTCMVSLRLTDRERAALDRLVSSRKAQAGEYARAVSMATVLRSIVRAAAQAEGVWS